MIITENWLREWIDLELDTAGLVERLTMAGLEVDSVTQAGPALAEVVAGRIEAIEPHPDADKLRVCQVDVGGTQRLQIVCGAANAQLGLLAPVALPGAVLADGTAIKTTRLRGVESLGMLCSGVELGIELQSAGLYVLDTGTLPGQPIDRLLQLDEAVIDIDLTPNRGDCLSILGIARELAVLTGARLKRTQVPGLATETALDIEVTVAEPQACPRYIGRVLTGVNARAATPVWMRERLRRCGIRPLSAVVDVTNYVMQELGQPMHAFDRRRLKGAIQVRRVQPGEGLTLLDGTALELAPDTLVIADDGGPVALAGIMGGQHSAIDEASDTIVLESAHFSPASIAGRARRYGLHTDSSHRFERGVDAELPVAASHYAAVLLKNITGGAAGPLIEATARRELPRRHSVLVRRQRIDRLLGYQLPHRQIASILKRVGQRVRRTAQGWQVTSKSFRFDLREECDYIEEIARVSGYEQIPTAAPLAGTAAPVAPERWTPLRRIKQLLADRDYREVVTYSFVDPAQQQALGGEGGIWLTNPIAANMAVMRTSLWSGLLNTAALNFNRQQHRLRLFEAGKTFQERDGGVTEQTRLGGLVAGPVTPAHWDTAARDTDFFDLKGDLESLLALTGVKDGCRFEAGAHPALHPGQCAQIVMAGDVIGVMGKLHPELHKRLGFEQPVFLFELTVTALQQGDLPAHVPVSRYPTMHRDLAVVVDEAVAAQAVLDEVRRAAGEALYKLELFDVYRGEGVDSGRKSLAFSLTLQVSSRTLTDVEVDSIVAGAVGALRQRFGAQLRT